VERGWLDRAAHPGLPVAWEDGGVEALQNFLPNISSTGMPEYTLDDAKSLVEQVVGMDPRPAHLRGREGDWYLRLLNFDVRVRVSEQVARIREVRA
jgi:hypothetical protein